MGYVGTRNMGAGVVREGTCQGGGSGRTGTMAGRMDARFQALPILLPLRF